MKDYTQPLPISEAPRDGTLVRLLVDYDDGGDHPLEDSPEPQWTVGFNNLTDTGFDEWQFVGWSWQQDIFCTGRGTPIAFAYLPPMQSVAPAPRRLSMAAGCSRNSRVPSDSAWQPDDGRMAEGDDGNG